MTAARRDFSDHVAARIDRDRQTAAQRARDEAVRRAAFERMRDHLLGAPDACLQLECEGALDAIKDVFTARRDGPGASSMIAARAYQPLISGPNARARAEQLFDRASAANDGDRR
ncbi:hypothetical protein ASG17_07685 [Brevundimonas sp. Leaf363]|uniref:hypothetical protein n=1 Tax=Brevundimonas sp. Leaf363 TaxID=1736353 RepID=UPI0006F27AA3|nr:hypothetical protein [Brevundimonas sp. Leaf363]KQS55923.1 hypothetical protein ASG17_07685 [Brevundimonas sp. Leaf363]